MLLKRNRNFNKTISDILVHPFLATFLFYTSGKKPKVTGVFRYKIGILARNGLIMKRKKSRTNFFANCWNFLDIF